MASADLKDRLVFVAIGIGGAFATVAIATEFAYGHPVLSPAVFVGCILPGLVWGAVLYTMSQRSAKLKTELSRLQDELKMPFSERFT